MPILLIWLQDIYRLGKNMTDETEKRLATLEANIQNIGNVIIEVKTWMKTTSLENREILARLQRMETKQDAFKEYQQECDKERKDTSDDVLQLKLDASRQAGKSSVWSAITATIISGFIAVLGALYGK